MSKTLTIFCPELLTPSLNQWQRMHWRARERWNKKVVEYIVMYGQGDLFRFDGKVLITVQRNRRNGVNGLDPDSAQASCKPILDALKKLDVIIDDSPEHVTLQVRQERVGMDGEWGTFIHIEREAA